MSDPARKTEETQEEQADTARSGRRRIAQPESGHEELPPPPEVLRKRPRVDTGAYSIVRNDKRSSVVPNAKDGRVAR